MESSIVLLSQKGDEVVIEWDPNDPKQHKTAEEAFKRLRDKGAIIYEVQEETISETIKTRGPERQLASKPKKKGFLSRLRGKQVHELDPAREQKLLARPAMSGG